MTNKQKLIEQYARAKMREERQQEIDYQIHGILPQLYAAFALALYNRGWDGDQIEELFVETQTIWDDIGADNMCRKCEELTGIDVEEGTNGTYQDS